MHARLDALQIRDLGPAAVSPEACSLATEEADCGHAGACLFGRCVDAAAVVGAAPTRAPTEAEREALTAFRRHVGESWGAAPEAASPRWQRRPPRP